jgi:hypothetical protein
MNSEAQRLAKLLQSLSAEDRKTLLDFATFLQQREQQPAAIAPVLVAPTLTARPQDESVVAAIRRLKQSYSMLASDELLHETADLMSEHLLKGKAAAEVIDQLEQLFADKYARYTATFEDAS